MILNTHEILLAKLDHYGVSGVANNLFKSYLSNRPQQTEINGTLSEVGIIKHGVPQGSVLGPLLFLLYINDISESSKVLKFFLLQTKQLSFTRIKLMLKLRIS